eukprot:TRINITY_DN50598_c0_g1_i1.p1 TRINITY_DN50598_c0_g1~~TRINITY_DN50598_c0_g1_i1.p1  ORF type:complete len:431 (-),score=75.75 TRINITY_DN50598_c0_g1_i1:86-1378(-)
MYLSSCFSGLRVSFVIVACASLLPLTSSVFRELSTQADALSLLKSNKATLETCSPDEAEDLVQRGWWEAARELVLQSHSLRDASKKTSLERVVRKSVTNLKLKADQVLLALDSRSQNSGQGIGVVRCAMQWAQNRSAIFLSIKFAHRWSSPGALKVQDHKFEASDCCFNFSATGDHSQLRKRYAVDLDFLEPISPKGWTWSLASAGRMTVEIKKQSHGKWKRLLKDKKQMKNVASWDSMKDRWEDDLDEFAKEQKRAERKEKKEKKTGKASTNEEREKELTKEYEKDAMEEEEIHDKLQKKCLVGKSDPFISAQNVERLCTGYWPPKMDTMVKGKDSTWLVIFFSPNEMKCGQKSAECQKLYNSWNAIGDRIGEVLDEEHWIGVLNCDLDAKLCKKEKVGHFPFIRRYKGGKKKTFYDEWSIDAVAKFLQ